MHQEHMQYDTSITQFSPDGRILQVEYAREAVKRGALSAAIKYRDGILVIADRPYHSSMVEKSSKEKINKVNPNCCCVSSGLVADSRVLVDYARRISAYHKVHYSEPIDITTLVTRICNVKRSMTQYGGARPFGVSMLFCGAEEADFHIFETDPSGAFKEHNAAAIGLNAPKAKELLHDLAKDFKTAFSVKDALSYMIGLFGDINEKFIPENLEICVVNADGVAKFDHKDFIEYLG